ncbi:MAG: transglutaminase domain-containing protein [Christensenellales bacterium]
MKKVASVLIIITLATILCVFAGCDFSSQKETPTLDAPQLSFDSQSISVEWNVVNNADIYYVKVTEIDGEDRVYNYTVYPESQKNCKLSVALEQLDNGTYTVDIQATAQGYNSAKASIEVVLSHNAPDDTPQDIEEEPAEIIDDNILINEDGELFLPQELYYKYSTDDLVINCADGVTITALSAVALGDNYSIDEEAQTVTISKYYLSQFSVGAKIPLTIYYGTDGMVKTYVNVVKALPYSLSGNVVTYTKLSGTGFSVNIIGATSSYDVVEKVAIDDVMLSNDYVAYSYISNKLTILENPFIKNLSVGEHQLQVFTKRGMSTALLIVKVGLKYEPYDVVIDGDSCYPKTMITWRDDADEIQKYTVVINGTAYNSIDYPHLFDGRSFDATGLISCGDSVEIKAYVGRYAYTSSTVYSYVDQDDPVQQKYLSDSFEFLGEQHNHYISSNAELVDFIYYYILHYDEFDAYETDDTARDYSKWKQAEIYVAIDGNAPQSSLSDTVRNCLKKFPEAMSVNSMTITKTINGTISNEVVVALWLKTATVPNPENTNSLEEQSYIEYVGNAPRYSKTGRAADYDDFAINSIEKTATMSTTFELYMAIERGYRPTPVASSDAERIYNKAKQVLRDIIDDEMDDFDKVRAIYDWLSCNVIYDHKLASDSATVDETTNATAYYALFGNAAFYAEGVFDNGLAVCNGIAIAFVILCRIEGIECYKVIGTSGNVGHAWNKVKIGGYWYICDATWASNAVNKVEYLVEDYLFMDNEKSSPDSKHIETASRSGGSEYYAGDTNYSVWANTWFVDKAEEKVYDTVLRDKAYTDALIEVIISEIENTMDVGSFYRVGVSCSSLKWNGMYGNSIISTADNAFEIVYTTHSQDSTKGYITFERKK